METRKMAMDDDQLNEVAGGTVLPYIVQPGDTLEEIAGRYHVTVDQLRKWNHLSSPDILPVGQTLRILY